MEEILKDGVTRVVDINKYPFFLFYNRKKEVRVSRDNTTVVSEVLDDDGNKKIVKNTIVRVTGWQMFVLRWLPMLLVWYAIDWPCYRFPIHLYWPNLWNGIGMVAAGLLFLAFFWIREHREKDSVAIVSVFLVTAMVLGMYFGKMIYLNYTANYVFGLWLMKEMWEQYVLEKRFYNVVGMRGLYVHIPVDKTKFPPETINKLEQFRYIIFFFIFIGGVLFFMSLYSYKDTFTKRELNSSASGVAIKPIKRPLDTLEKNITAKELETMRQLGIK